MAEMLMLDQIRHVLAELLSAFDYSLECKVDRWQFALSVPELMSRGATLTDVRYLVLRKSAELARETSIPGDTVRSFRELPIGCFSPDAFVVLSERGALEVRLALTDAAPVSAEQVLHSRQLSSSRATASANSQSFPIWNPIQRELSYRGELVKKFRVPAPNQELLLAALQEEGWPKCLDDPLPPDEDHDAKERLKGAIKGLNRNQLKQLLRFHGNGNGLQVYWEPISRS